MGYQSKMLTNGEHDVLWRNLFGTHVPNIDRRLGYLTVLNAAKELHDMEIIKDETYVSLTISAVNASKVCGEINETDLTYKGKELLKKKES